MYDDACKSYDIQIKSNKYMSFNLIHNKEYIYIYITNSKRNKTRHTQLSLFEFFGEDT